MLLKIGTVLSKESLQKLTMLIKKFIVFDRDGTLIKYIPYLSDPSSVELAPGAKEFVNNLLKNSNKLFLHTNQSGVSRGVFSLQDVIKCNERLIELLGFGNDLFERICIATELNLSKNSYRKPSPRFANEIINDYKIDRSDLFYIGDNISDLETADNTGCNAYGIINKKISSSVENNNLGYRIFKNIKELNNFFYEN